ncbi:MAG: mevalonate kinase, partial [Candidatus Altiarchaeales archaeon]|nr:mevalonate kinase [Candidatus Altiarchaeales archaeon]
MLDHCPPHPLLILTFFLLNSNILLMSVGHGYGKTILFGEHFVVYGLPAVASALGVKTTAVVEDSPKFEFNDNRPETPGYKAKKRDEIQRQVDALKEYFRLDEKKPVKITLSGDLVCASGVGASAALAASIARALSAHLNLNLSDEEINDAAYIAEEAGSGTPSGIDNTCAVYGGFIVFKKNLAGGKNDITPIKVSKPIEIVMASSGITQTTKEVVADVKRLKEENPEQYKKIFNDYQRIVEAGIKAIKSGDLKALGNLMDENQKLLAEMTLSCPEIEKIITAAKNAGAYGAKLTGTGRGG